MSLPFYSRPDVAYEGNEPMEEFRGLEPDAACLISNPIHAGLLGQILVIDKVSEFVLSRRNIFLHSFNLSTSAVVAQRGGTVSPTSGCCSKMLAWDSVRKALHQSSLSPLPCLLIDFGLSVNSIMTFMIRSDGSLRAV